MSERYRGMWKIALALASALELGACAPDDSGVTGVERDDGALLNGISTTLRPEIGSLQLSGGCTATLVAPDIVVAASHCVTYTDANVTGSFTITAGGVSTPFSALRTFAIGGGNPSNLSSGLGNSDVSLVQLATRVPGTLATPAKLASALPSGGTAATIFGFGCQNRSTQTGGGAKQFVQYTYGQTTNNLCPGDSGGPRVTGGPSGSGPVFAVNSGFNNSGDVTGDAVFYGTPGLAAVNRLANTVATNPSVPKFGFYAAGIFTQPVAGDFDGNGVADLALWDPGQNGSVPVAFSGDNPGFGSWGAVVDGPYHTTDRPIAAFYTLIPDWAKLVAGDFDGDGRTDLALVGGKQGTLPVAFSNGDGTFRVTNLSPGAIFANLAHQVAGGLDDPGPQVLTGDFNGDRLTDIVLIMPPSSKSTQIPIAFSNGDGTFRVTTTSNSQFTTLAQETTSGLVQKTAVTYDNRAVVGDFDGDGADDIALVGNVGFGVSGYAATTTFPVATSNRDGSFKVTTNSVDHFGEWTQGGSKVVAGDFDGDGKADLAAVGGSVTGWSSNIAFAFSTGGGHFVPGNLPIATFPDLAGQVGTNHQVPKALAGKFTWNQQADIVLLGGSGWTSVAMASMMSKGFAPLSLQNGWTDGPYSTADAAIANTPGFIQLRGGVANGSSAVPFTLPVGMRPSTTVFVPVDLANATFGRLMVGTDGVVSVEAEGGAFSNASTFTSLEGVSFPVNATGYTALALQNGWTNAPFGTRNAAIKNDAGIVRFQGAIATSGANAQPFTLPTAFRPATDVYLPVGLCNAKKGRLHVGSNGAVTISEEGGGFSNAQCFTSLEGATFALAPAGYTPLALVNGWSNAPFATRNAAALTDDNGVVHLQGAIAGGSSSMAFTMPTGMHPSKAVYVNVDLCDAAKGRLSISTDGTVNVQTVGPLSDATCFTSLEGAAFSL